MMAARLTFPIAGLLLSLSVPAHAQLTFGPSREIAEFVSYPRDTRAVDMDGDGDLDVISREASDVRVYWWENDGGGRFGNRHSWTWGDLDHEVISLADANNDGRPDVWLRRMISRSDLPPYPETYRYYISLADAGGGFGEPQQVADFHYQNSANTSARVVDLNGDGRADLLMGDGMWIRREDGSFQPPPAGSFQPGSLIEELGEESGRGAVATGDFDGDGDIDLAFGAPGLMISFNLGNGLLAAPVSSGFTRPGENIGHLTAIPPVAAGSRARLLLAGNLGGAGGPEPRLAAGVFSDSGAFSAIASEMMAGSSEHWDIAGIAWDIQGNRAVIASTGQVEPDLPELHAPLDVTAFSIPESGGAFVKTALFATDGFVNGISLADLDGDGESDLLFPLTALSGISGICAGELRWYGRTEAGGFGPARSITPPAMMGEIVFAGDVDGDGDGDLVTLADPPLFNLRGLSPDGRQHLILWENLGGALSFKRHEISTGHLLKGVIAVEDHDGDGDLDILAQTYDIQGKLDDGVDGIYYGNLRLVWLARQADGSYSEQVLFQQTTLGLLRQPELVDWDLNDHGPSFRDIVALFPPLDSLGDLYGRKAVIFRGNGGGFAAPVFFSPSHDSFLASWDDIDQDGDPDYTWILDYTPASFGFWLQNNNGAVSAAAVLPRPYFPLGVDIDGDGFNDYAGGRGVLLARPGFQVEELSITGGEDHDETLGFVDLDSDGDLDLLSGRPVLGVAPYAELMWRENDGSGFRAPRPLAGPVLSDRKMAVMGDMDGDGIKDLVIGSMSFNLRLEWFKVTKQAAPPAFIAWMAGKGLKGNLAGPMSDAEGDGATNWQEFIFGSDPAVADPASPALPRLEKSGNGWRYTFQRNSGLAASPQIQTSTDLREWTPFTGTLPSAPGGTGYERCWLESTAPGPLFFRTVVPSP